MRPPRIDFPGARHHVMNRGARKAPIFTDTRSRELFLEVLSELPGRFGVGIHSYALMPNHYHLMLESRTGGLSRAMRHLGGTYTRRLNRHHAWDGPLFRGRFHSRLVDTDSYWRHLLLYVHLNPVRAGLTPPSVGEWTSHRAYIGATPCPPWLTTADLLQHYGRSGYLDAYEALCDNRSAAPAGFDPDRLWAPNAAGTTVDIPPSAHTVQSGFDELCAVTGMTPEEILSVPKGPRPNKANWLAAWWWSRSGIDHGQIKRAMLTTHSSVSLKIRRVEERRASDPDLKRWSEQLVRERRES